MYSAHPETLVGSNLRVQQHIDGVRGKDLQTDGHHAVAIAFQVVEGSGCTPAHTGMGDPCDRDKRPC